jgi:hypothetical protein
MKIELPKDKDSTDIETICCWITCGKYEYYFDDSIDGEVIVKRWCVDSDDDNDCEVLSCQ